MGSAEDAQDLIMTLAEEDDVPFGLRGAAVEALLQQRCPTTETYASLRRLMGFRVLSVQTIEMDQKVEVLLLLGKLSEARSILRRSISVNAPFDVFFALGSPLIRVHDFALRSIVNESLTLAKAMPATINNAPIEMQRRLPGKGIANPATKNTAPNRMKTMAAKLGEPFWAFKE